MTKSSVCPSCNGSGFKKVAIVDKDVNGNKTRYEKTKCLICAGKGRVNVDTDKGGKRLISRLMPSTRNIAR